MKVYLILQIKNLDDTGSGDNLVLGLKSKEKLNVKSQQGGLLAQTDWAVIRKADTGTAIPSKIATYRAAIRTKATAMEECYKMHASDMAAFKALFLTHKKDSDGKIIKSGILFDWPELEE